MAVESSGGVNGGGGGGLDITKPDAPAYGGLLGWCELASGLEVPLVPNVDSSASPRSGLT